eukprot:37841-Lingulodinium_polyedra.AAC.1
MLQACCLVSRALCTAAREHGNGGRTYHGTGAPCERLTCWPAGPDLTWLDFWPQLSVLSASKGVPQGCAPRGVGDKDSAS